MRVCAAFVGFLIVVAAGAYGATATKLVYRVDRATATIDDRHLVITARGAVPTGGWAKPELRVRVSSVPEAKTLEVYFMAKPPQPGAAVIQAIVPLRARVSRRLPRYGIAEVKVVSQTNSVTVPITLVRNPTKLSAEK
ncbi:MAG: hypothetical protein KGJ79_06330 [Alphaproteobacteria bacterium]|nr:hypothetical protein [Alphaproteobacteria bacterium]MDE2110740.1 hypothetical protein [Alphaproteobacteria bacterium]MDE2494545.1 hypothetical protein [Alphaproteobacteria bacterium]